MNEQSRAQKRWKLLAGAVTGHTNHCPIANKLYSPNYLGFSGSLFQTRDLHFEQNYALDSSTSESFRWIEYTPTTLFDNEATEESRTSGDQSCGLDSLHLRVYASLLDEHLTKQSDSIKHRLNTLSGFDNTGNVNIWLSELLLAHAFLRGSLYPGLYHLLIERFPPGSCERICELGGGMTGAAGLAACASRRQSVQLFKPSYVLLTDGNVRCVQSLKVNVAHNVERFRHVLSEADLRLEARELAWKAENEAPNIDPSLIHSFDLVLAADCFFNPTGHRGLLQLVDSLLYVHRHSALLAIAPWRGSSLAQFLSLVTGLPDQWRVTRLEPETYMHPKLYAHLLRTLGDIPTEVVLDKYIGQIILVERVP